MITKSSRKKILALALSTLLTILIILTLIPPATAVLLSPGNPDVSTGFVGTSISFHNVTLIIRGPERIPIDSIRFSIFSENNQEISYVIFEVDGEEIQDYPFGCFEVNYVGSNPSYSYGYGYSYGYDEIGGYGYTFDYGYGYGYGDSGSPDVIMVYDITYTPYSSGTFYAKLTVNSDYYSYVSSQSLTFSVQATNPPVPQKNKIEPLKWSAITDTVDFLFDFDDLEEDIDYLELSIFGPAPYDTNENRIQMKFLANEIDPWDGWLDTDKTIFLDMGISPNYSALTESWMLTINTSKIWTMENPWTQPINSSVWPSGLYDFYIEVGDKKGNKWGDIDAKPEYAHYVYSIGLVQPLIDASSSGNTIYLCNGTFDDRLTINKTINLIGQGPFSIIQPSYTPQAGVYDVSLLPGSSNTVIKNILFDFNGINDDRSGTGISVSGTGLGPVNNVKIIENVFYIGERTGIGGIAIQTGRNSDVSDLLIQENIFYGDSTSSGEGIHILPYYLSGSEVKIYKNKFAGYLYSGITIESSNVYVSSNEVNNSISQGTFGILFTDLSGGQSYNGVSIISNEIQNLQYGICVGTSSNVGSTLTASISSNILTNNNVGIWVRYGANLLASIHFNDIFNNTLYGLINDGTSGVSATYNWWGDETGPYNPSSNPSGLGDNVSSNVDFSSWLSAYWDNIIWVDDNYDSTTPGWGIDHFSNVTDGLNAVFDSGAVFLKPGVYKELIKIEKPVTLAGFFNDPYLCVITDEDATYSQIIGTDGQTIQILSNDVTIDGLCVKRLEDFTFTVPNTAAIGNYGVTSELVNITLQDCVIYSLYNGIQIENSNGLYVSNNEIFGGTNDIVARAVEIFEIVNNTMANSTLNGLKLSDCHEGIVISNNATGKIYSGIHIDNSSEIIITESLLINNSKGILSDNSLLIELTNNSLKNNSHGIELYGITHAKFNNNSFENNTFDIYHTAHVEGYDYYGNIQHAVDSAGLGYNVYVYPGTYKENVIIDKTIILTGIENRDGTIIDGTLGDAALYLARFLNTKDITVKNLSIKGGTSCVKTGIYNDVSGLKIENCRIFDPIGSYAVYIDPNQYSDYPPIREGTLPFYKPATLYNNYIRGGILYQYDPFEIFGINIGSQLLINNNDLDRVFLNSSMCVRLENNILWSLGMRNSYDVYIANNEISNYPGYERYGIYLWSIEGQNPVKKVTILNNTIIGYGSYQVSSGVVGKGILIAGAEDVTLNENEIRANSEGVWVTGDYYNLNNDHVVGEVSNLKIQDNHITINQVGIMLKLNVNFSDIVDNSLFNNGIALRIEGSSNNTVFRNEFSENQYGIRIDKFSNDNIIYNNLFSNNVHQAIDLYCNNSWNISLIDATNIMGGPKIGGNYWDDYVGEDLNGDQIGDTNIPYNSFGEIANGGDYLPLMLVDFIPPDVEVIHPNGGEIFNESTISIQWLASDNTDQSLSIDIEYSDDGGDSWNLISSNEQNDGFYLWDISELFDGTDYLIKINATDNSNNQNSDTSDGNFTIVGKTYPGPEINIINPSGGWIYFFNTKLIRVFQNVIFAIGHLTFQVEANSPIGIEKVELYVDNELVSTITTPINGMYSYTWDERSLLYHTVKVKAYDNSGQHTAESFGIIIFNFDVVP